MTAVTPGATSLLGHISARRRPGSLCGGRRSEGSTGPMKGTPIGQENSGSKPQAGLQKPSLEISKPGTPAGGWSSPARGAGFSTRCTCRMAAQRRATHRHQPASATPDPDTALRDWLRQHVTDLSASGVSARPSRRPRRELDGRPHKKFQGIWREEGLLPMRPAGCGRWTSSSTPPPTVCLAPNWGAMSADHQRSARISPAGSGSGRYRSLRYTRLTGHPVSNSGGSLVKLLIDWLYIGCRSP